MRKYSLIFYVLLFSCLRTVTSGARLQYIINQLAHVLCKERVKYNGTSQGGWQNMFAIAMFRYIEVLYHISYYYCGEE